MQKMCVCACVCAPARAGSCLRRFQLCSCEPGLGQVDQKVQQGVPAQETLLLEKLFLLGLDAQEYHAPLPTEGIKIKCSMDLELSGQGNHRQSHPTTMVRQKVTP